MALKGLFFWSQYFLLLVLLTYLSLTPLQADALPSVPHADKLAHTGFYFLLSFSCYFSWWVRPILFKNTYALLWAVFVFHTGYGMVIEGLQAYLIPGRFGEWEDALANALGVFLANLVSFFWFLKKSRIK